MTTKEQERKAMEKIRGIVNGLGEYSYIGSAMEGVWEIMEENIDNDFALSMGDRLKEKDKEIKDLTELAYNADKAMKDAVDAVSAQSFKLGEAEKEIESLKKVIDSNGKEISDRCGQISQLEDENSDYVTEIASLKDEIIHLKAKLYDLMVKEG